MFTIDNLIVYWILNQILGNGGEGGGGTGDSTTVNDVVVLVADFSDTETYTVLSGAYYGTKRAIVS